MRTTSASPAELAALVRGTERSLAAVRRGHGAAEDAVAALRHGTDPALLHLDPGLLAAVDALVDGWQAADRFLRRVGAAMAANDAAGAAALAVATARVRAATRTAVTADHLRDELEAVADGRPDLVAAWFAAVSPTELALLERDDWPALGALDGAPLELRHRVNRRLVVAELERVQAELDGDGWLQRNVGIPLVGDGWRDGHQADLDRRAALQQLLAADLILLFDPRGDGRAVAAYGDPGTADHVATVVPGISNHLGNLGNVLDDAAHLQRAAERRRDGTVATIAWLGYDTPGSIGNHTLELVTEATHGGRAADAADDLARFVAGVDAVRDDAAHLTVIGHSYGSVVLGAALSQGELRVDEAVAVGSPGMGVDHVSDWDLPPSTTVWAASAGSAGPGWWLPGGGDDLVAHAPFHGPNPAAASFGARGFDVTGASGHSSYFATDAATGRASISLRSLATIVVDRPPAPDPARFEFAPGPPGPSGRLA